MWGLIAIMMVGVVGITLMENDHTDQNDADLMDDPEDEPGRHDRKSERSYCERHNGAHRIV